MAAGELDGHIVLARIGKPHGILGWVKLHSFTSPPENALSYAEFTCTDRSGQVLKLELDAHRATHKDLLAHFRGFDDPQQASRLTGLELAVDRTALPELDAGEYYWHQLQGLAVVNTQGEFLGTIRRLLETGANDVLAVAPTPDSIDDNERLIPYLRDRVVVRIDLAAGRMTVDWPRDYLV